MREPREVSQRIQIRQLGKIIGGQNKRRKIRYRSREVGLYAIDSIPCEEQGVQARGEGEVREGGDVVVCEVDCILVLHSASVAGLGMNSIKVNRGERGNGQTFATPKFSMAGILWPACLQYDINGAHFFKV